MLSSNRVVAVPPLVNDIADSLGWLLWEAPFPLATSYATIAIKLRWMIRAFLLLLLNPPAVSCTFYMLLVNL